LDYDERQEQLAQDREVRRETNQIHSSHRLRTNTRPGA
jgi:hypothetical protein